MKSKVLFGEQQSGALDAFDLREVEMFERTLVAGLVHLVVLGKGRLEKTVLDFVDVCGFLWCWLCLFLDCLFGCFD